MRDCNACTNLVHCTMIQFAAARFAARPPRRALPRRVAPPSIPFLERHPHEDSRVPRQGNLAQVRRARAARHPGLHGAGGGRSRAEARRPGVGGQGPDPRRRPRQGRRRQGRQVDRRRQEAGRRDPGHAAQDAPDRPRRPEGAPPVHRGRRRHPEGILRLGRDRPRDAEGGLHRLQRRRHGHRGSGARHAREDHHGVRRPAGRPDRGAGARNSPTASACRPTRTAQAVDVCRSSTSATWTPTPRWSRSTR